MSENVHGGQCFDSQNLVCVVLPICSFKEGSGEGQLEPGRCHLVGSKLNTIETNQISAHAGLTSQNISY